MKLLIVYAVALSSSSVLGFSSANIGKSETSSSRVSSGEGSKLRMGLLDMLGLGKNYGDACVMGDESIMSPKSHGTSETPVQENLRWNSDNKVADRICNFNRHYAEHSGYWTSTEFLKESKEEYDKNGEIKFYDSNTGKLLFVAPKGRTYDDFIKESRSHGWPSFRDSEVVWDDVRCLPNGEAISMAGTHLGHNLPDATGNRYCINLVSVAGVPTEE
jgi:peptide methionine sulfoxide reductase MsrB